MRYDARLLAAVLRAPERAAALDGDAWTQVIAMARAEQVLGTLAHRTGDLPLPAPVTRLLEDARAAAAQVRIAALWEADMARRALAPLDLPVVLLKGTAYAAAGLDAARGRQIGDLDILVPRGDLDRVERALLGAGWEWLKQDPYDDAYYRRWMHELPPLHHVERERMIDVHHTILPLTAAATPDAAALIADSVVLPDGLRILSPHDRIVHAAAHMLADGDLSGGLRNLWDLHCLFGETDISGLAERARHHGLGAAVSAAMRLAHALYGTAVPEPFRRLTVADRAVVRRLVARDGWGRRTRPVVRFGFYARSHLLRMPPAMLARHLWTKYRSGYRPIS